MDTDSIIQLISIVILLILSGFFSSAETSFISVNKIKLLPLAQEGNRRAQMVIDIIDQPAKMLSAVLIGNNIVNISCSALTTSFTISIWGNKATGIATGVLTLLVLIFGEITPKSTANIHATKMAMAYAPIIKALMTILTPVIYIVDRLAGFFLWLLRIDSQKKEDIFTEEEIRTIVNESQKEGVIESSEKKIINNLFDFGDSTAKDIMIPRIDMTLADVNSSYDDIISLFRQTMYTRIPIYENTPDNVIGILNIKDLIVNPANNDTFDIRNIMRKPFFTFEQKNTSDLFRDMQISSTSIAIVLSEYGTTSGMITTEDLLEEIVGEIRDEYDTDEKDALSKINDNTYRVDGSFKLDDLNDELGTSLESEDNDSIGGLIIEKLDSLPKAGDKLIVDNVWMFVEKASSNRAESVIIKLLPKKDNSDN
ncbi:MAG: HlyC/CorC family transporter [Lachnospira sp.]